jgi:endonuclease-3
VKPKNVETLFTRLRQKLPEPTTELAYDSPFELLVAVILSAQATDVSVNLATAKLYPVANTPDAILSLGVEGLKRYIRTIGLFNTKAENIIKTCRILLEQHRGEVPAEREALEALPGVGRKTANVILNTAFGQPTIAVDTHIFRVSNRLGLAPGDNVLAVEKGLMKAVPEKYRMDAHHWLILHGRYTCVARAPKCDECVLNDICPSAFRAQAGSVSRPGAARQSVGRKKKAATSRTRKPGKPSKAKKASSRTGKKRAASAGKTAGQPGKE